MIRMKAASVCTNVSATATSSIASVIVFACGALMCSMARMCQISNRIPQAAQFQSSLRFSQYIQDLTSQVFFKF